MCRTLKNNMFENHVCSQQTYISISVYVFFCGTAKEKFMLLKGGGDSISLKLLILAVGCGLHFLKPCYCHLEM
jgi:hypothetical protein